MSILAELNALLDDLNVPVETGEFSSKAPDNYAVLTPLVDEFEVFADNLPTIDIKEVRISFFSKGNYLIKQSQIIYKLLAKGFTITGRRFIELELDTNFYHTAIDVAKYYTMEEIT
ncbi:MAG: hypothetical protein LBS41_04625 [Streptococcaceae bacterium]|jgi:hypothetical protein|nr:hypothetical protein [Streptococcaceae bacterium]